MAKKKILFVSYGGVHVHMLAPLILECRKIDELETHVIGLTAAPGIYRNKYGIECESAKDYITSTDGRVHQFGREILAQMKANGEKIIDEEETIAYLGTGFADLVQQKESVSKAWDIFNNVGRSELLPLTFMKRVFDRIQPDLLVTTNSPRGEKAANLVAKERGIQSILIPDLYCIYERYSFVSDIICVISEEARQNLMLHHHIPKNKIIVTGNPYYDESLEFRGPVNVAWRAEHLPFSSTDHLFLWADQHNYYDVNAKRIHARSAESIETTLDCLKSSADKNNSMLLVRPHPSQDEQFYKNWCNQNDVIYADHDLLPLLSAVDVIGSFESTVLIHALQMSRPVLQLNVTGGPSFLPIEHLENVWVARGLDQLSPTLRNIRASFTTDWSPSPSHSSATEKVLKVIYGTLALT